MAIDQKNSYEVGVNSDLTNALLNIDLNRIGGDLTYLENDGGTLKVSVGSLIEANGSIYAVSGSAETPSGTAQDGAYLFFDPSGPSFAWSTTPGTYDAALGGIYDGSDRRQCRFRLKSATTWDALLIPESPDIAFEGDVAIDGVATIDDGNYVVSSESSTPQIRIKVLEIGDWNMDTNEDVSIAHGVNAAKIRHVTAVIRDDSANRYWPLFSDLGDFNFGVFGGLFYGYDSTNVKLFRTNASAFDSTDFNATGYNRGWITIWYEV
jgi:hypothetical protein